MDERRTGTAEQARLEYALEAVADGKKGGYELVFNPVTGQVVATVDVADEDRLPATQMAREGFFCGSVAVRRLARWAPRLWGVVATAAGRSMEGTDVAKSGRDDDQGV